MNSSDHPLVLGASNSIPKLQHPHRQKVVDNIRKLAPFDQRWPLGNLRKHIGFGAPGVASSIDVLGRASESSTVLRPQQTLLNQILLKYDFEKRDSAATLPDEFKNILIRIIQVANRLEEPESHTNAPMHPTNSLRIDQTSDKTKPKWAALPIGHGSSNVQILFGKPELRAPGTHQPT